MKFTAKLAGYSSIVGQSIMLQDESGRVICQLAMLNVGGEDHKASCAKIGQAVVDLVNRKDPAPDMVAYKIKDSRGDYWQTTVEGHPYNFRIGIHHTPMQWIKTSERQPAVGGSYITGDYIDDGVLPRRFDRSRNRYVIILKKGPTWRELEYDIHGREIDRTIDPPEYWLENLPPHPEYKP